MAAAPRWPDRGIAKPAEQAPWAAVQAALEMLDLTAQFNRERRTAGKAVVRASIGIASGPAIVGEGGTRRRAAYVCVGATVRRAVRLQALAARGAARSLVLLDEMTEAALASRVATDTMQAVVLPGSAAAVTIYALTDTNV